MDPESAGGATVRRERLDAVIALSIVPCLFLAVDPHGWFPFGPVKWWVASTMGVVGFLVVIRGQRPVRVERPILIAWTAVLTVFGIAAVRGVDPGYAWIGTPERRLGWITWLLFALVFLTGRTLEPTVARRVLRVVLPITGVGVGAVAMLQTVGISWGPITGGGSRPGSTFGSAAFLGSATVLLLPPLVGGVIVSWRSGRRSATGVHLLASVLVGAAAVSSGTRGAWAGLGLAAMVVGVSRTWARRRSGEAGTTTADQRPAGVIVIGIVLIMVSTPALLLVPNPISGRIASLTDRDAAGGVARLDEWRVATRIVTANPIIGVGPEGHRIAFGAAADDAYERAHGRDPLPDRAHSAPLDVAVTSGLLGLIAWSVLLGTVGRRVWRRSGDGDPLDAGIATGLIGVAAASLVLFPNVEVDTAAWLLAGVLVGAADRVRTTGPLVTVVPASGRWRAPVTVGVTVLGAIAMVTGATGVIADREAADAATAWRQGRTRAALVRAQRAVDLRPDVLRQQLLLARIRTVVDGGHRAAVRDLDRASVWSPQDPVLRSARTTALVELAAATRLPTDVEVASQAVAELVATDPSLTDAWELARRIAVLDQRPDDVDAATERLRDLRSGADVDSSPPGGRPR